MADEKSNPHLFVIERRREERRILVHVPVEVTATDAAGNQTTERTFIEDVSDFGCRFTTRGPIEQGEIISLKILGPQGNELPDEAPRLYEIMWVARKERGVTVGARLRRGEKPANIKLPPEGSD